MLNLSKSKKAFTFIEVMVSVMIISVVIMAMIQMYSNNTFIFSNLKKQTQVNQYVSFLIANEKYGLENDSLDLYRLVEDFDIEDDLRKELKAKKIDIIYQELNVIDLSEEESLNRDTESQMNSSLVFEIGKSIIKSDTSSSGLVRFRIQI